VDARLEKAKQLKLALIDFVYEAEGEMAIALEKYAAERGSKERQGIGQQNLTIDTFITEGKVNNKSPLEIFIEDNPDLTQSDRHLLDLWRSSFTGLFEILEVLPFGFKLMNWLTAKHYIVISEEQILRAATEKTQSQPGEILLGRIAPISDRDGDWIFLSDPIVKGKLSKPKLAVAIGEFKDSYKNHLYSDAPDLLEEAWQSVGEYHREFVDFFDSDRITLPGYQLNQKMSELQSKISKKRLAAAGIDDSKSLSEIIRDSGADETEITTAASEFGTDSDALLKTIKSSEKLSTVIPKINLPEEIKKADKVTVFSDPRWGQMFVPSYSKFQEIVESNNPQSFPNCEKIVRKYLEDPQINFFIWQQLQQQYPTKLEILLQDVLQSPTFNLDRNLTEIFAEFNKPIEPDLPEIASIPKHLNDLFEEAVAQVHKSKSKDKKKTQKTKGFQR
jgi:hypothetical protein